LQWNVASPPILAADVVGYSWLMEQNEAGTPSALKERRRIILNPIVAQRHGRIVKVMGGDGVLVEFGTAVNAVQCALDLQAGMAEATTGRKHAGSCFASASTSAVKPRLDWDSSGKRRP
jgi:class 3 adenylate cyclase